MNFALTVKSFGFNEHYEALTWPQHNFETEGFDILSAEFQTSNLNLSNVSSYFFHLSDYSFSFRGVKGISTRE